MRLLSPVGVWSVKGPPTSVAGSQWAVRSFGGLHVGIWLGGRLRT